MPIFCGLIEYGTGKIQSCFFAGGVGRKSTGSATTDLAACLERADIWIAKQQGRHIPQTEEVGFSPQEVAAILHLLGSVRRLNTESEALWEFEKRIRALLGKMNAEQVNEAVAANEESELYEHAEQVRKNCFHIKKPHNPLKNKAEESGSCGRETRG